MTTTRPTLYHDPTSEPSRAVHWLCVAAGLPVDIEHVWLTRGEHRSSGFLAINPRHQVPALIHGSLHLSEATAIMAYLAEINACSDRWFGATPPQRARTAMLLSWYHTSIRLMVTLEYFLPVLLMPAYNGAPPPGPEAVARIQGAFRESLDHLEALLDPGPYLAGGRVMVADLLFATELYALDIDPDRGEYLDRRRRVAGWLERMRACDGYDLVHGPWNHVVPMIIDRRLEAPCDGLDPRWVADACREVMSDPRHHRVP